MDWSAVETVRKEAFSVIGTEGSTGDGEGFIQTLWKSSNDRFGEIAPLVKLDGQGNHCGYWGLMSDFSRSFRPWEEFSRGLYLAGPEVQEGSAAPPGWTLWTAPASEYLRVKVDGEPGGLLREVLGNMEERGIPLAGAVYDYFSPGEGGQMYLYLPTRRL